MSASEDKEETFYGVLSSCGIIFFLELKIVMKKGKQPQVIFIVKKNMLVKVILNQKLWKK